jgi:hypothetical protein
MNKYMALLGILLLAGVSFSVRFPDPYTGYRFEVSDCRADMWYDFFFGAPNPYWGCASQELSGQILALDDELYGDGSPGLLSQMEDTVIAADECYNGNVDYACLARYRLQFRSQQGTFNSLMATGNRLLMQAGIEAMSGHCVSQQEFLQDYLDYAYSSAMCNGGRR